MIRTTINRLKFGERELPAGTQLSWDEKSTQLVLTLPEGVVEALSYPHVAQLMACDPFFQECQKAILPMAGQPKPPAPTTPEPAPKKIPTPIVPRVVSEARNRRVPPEALKNIQKVLKGPSGPRAPKAVDHYKDCPLCTRCGDTRVKTKGQTMCRVCRIKELGLVEYHKTKKPVPAKEPQVEPQPRRIDTTPIAKVTLTQDPFALLLGPEAYQEYLWAQALQVLSQAKGNKAELMRVIKLIEQLVK